MSHIFHVLTWFSNLSVFLLTKSLFFNVQNRFLDICLLASNRNSWFIVVGVLTGAQSFAVCLHYAISHFQYNKPGVLPDAGSQVQRQ